MTNKIKLHLILNANDEAVVSTIKNIPNVEIVQWDYSFDTALEWTIRNEAEKVDIFFASEYAQVSVTKDDNKQIPRDAALLKKIRELHLARPQAKFILLCDEERSLPENRHFLVNLVAMGIYDFRLTTNLSEDLLVEMIKEPKRDIIHVREYLPEISEDVNISTDIANITKNRNIEVIKEKPKLRPQKIKTIFAAGENLKDRLDLGEVEVVADIAVREQIIPSAEELQPDVVILSVYLRGNTDYLEIAQKLTAMNIRLIFLAGDLSPDSIEISKLQEMRIKEILYNPVDLGLLEKMLLRPEPSGELTFKENGKKRVLGGILSHSKTSETKTTKKVTLFSKTVFVWSPVVAGKSIIALNLSAYAAKMGYKVALIDADPACALHTYTQGVSDGQYLTDALLDDPFSTAHTISLLPELLIFTNDPSANCPILTDKNLRKLAGILEEETDLVVVDMPCSSGLLQKLTDAPILLIADQNWHHIKKIQRSLDEGWLPENAKLVLNNAFESKEIPIKDIEKALGQINSAIIPARTKEIMEGIKTGIPAVLFDKPLQQGFSNLLHEIIKKEK